MQEHKISGFSGQNIKRIKVQPKEWEHFLNWSGGDPSQSKMRQFFGVRGQLPRVLSESEKKAWRQKEAHKHNQEDTGGWIKNKNRQDQKRREAREKKRKAHKFSGISL
jgi:hypothetical protein